MKAIKLGYIGSVLYTVETVVGRTRVQVPLSQQNNINTKTFVIFVLILQQIEGNLIYPKVMGNRVHLPGMWVLAAVTVGGGIAGPIGMLLSVPLASTAYMLIKEATVKREEKLKKIEEE